MNLYHDVIQANLKSNFKLYEESYISLNAPPIQFESQTFIWHQSEENEPHEKELHFNII